MIQRNENSFDDNTGLKNKTIKIEQNNCPLAHQKISILEISIKKSLKEKHFCFSGVGIQICGN